MNSLGVVLLTYNRFDYAVRTLRSTLDNLQCQDVQLRVHIASDGDTTEYIQALRELGGGYAHVVSVTHSNSQRGGYGANYNLAMQTIHGPCEYTLPLEDDWELTRPLDVAGVISEMSELGLGCVRLGYLGWTQDLRCTFAQTSNRHYWLRLDPNSPEPHVFSGHPRIEARWWARRVGPWPERLNPGETEFSVAHRRDAREGVGWPLSLVAPHGDLFVHVGAHRSY